MEEKRCHYSYVSTTDPLLRIVVAVPDHGGWQHGKSGDVYAPPDLYVVFAVVDQVVVHSFHPVTDGDVHTFMMISTTTGLCVRDYYCNDIGVSHA